MDWRVRFYPPDVFVGLKTQMEALIANGNLRAPEIVREELDAVGTPALKSWAKSQQELFVLLEPALHVEAAAVQASYPELVDVKSDHESADP
jgi:hypothetical protein